MDLKRLADALNRRGFKARVAHPGICVHRGLDYWGLDGESEDGSFAFALLDDMEKAGLYTRCGTGFKTQVGTDQLIRGFTGEYCNGWNGSWKSSFAATRTEAIVNAYLAADAAGLLEKGEGR